MTATGQPLASPKATTSAGSATGSVVPGTGSTPAASTARRAASLSPIWAMASGGGPTQTRPAAVTALAKPACSLSSP